MISSSGGPFINIAIEEKKELKIISFIYNGTIDIEQSQNVSVTIMNVGSIPVTAQIFIDIFYYSNGSLVPEASYIDFPVYLEGGYKHTFKIKYYPSKEGTFYIRVKVPYDSKVIEAWGLFYVKIFPITLTRYTTPTPIEVPKISYYLVSTKMELFGPDKIELYQGESGMINMTLQNKGEIDLGNIIPYLSVPSFVNYRINPPVVSVLGVNQSVVFMISFDIPSNATPGSYDATLEVHNPYSSARKSFVIELKGKEFISPDYIYHLILSYRYIISRIEPRISYFYFRGFDVTLPNKTLSLAKETLYDAKRYYEKREYDFSLIKLNETRKYLEQTMIEIECLVIVKFMPMAYLPFVIIIVVLIVITVLFLYRKRKKRKIPKLLREVIEEKKV